MKFQSFISQLNFSIVLLKFSSLIKNLTAIIAYLTTKEKRSKVWSKDLVYEKTFRLSNRTPHAFSIYYELIKINFQNLKFLASTKKTNDKKKRRAN